MPNMYKIFANEEGFFYFPRIQEIQLFKRNSSNWMVTLKLLKISINLLFIKPPLGGPKLLPSSKKLDNIF